MDIKRLMMSMVGMSALFGVNSLTKETKLKRIEDTFKRDRRLEFKTSKRSRSLRSKANRRKAKRLK